MSTSALAPTTTQSLESATTVDMHTPENASATEHTPLLSRDVPERGRQFYNIPTAPKSTSAPWLYHAVTLVFVFVSFLLCLAVGIILTGHSYAAPLLQADPALLAQRALAFEGPTHVNVLNYTSDGLWCEIAGAAAIDTALLLGLSSNRLTDKLVRWAVRQVGSITVSTSTVDIYSSTGAYLGGLQLPDIVLPLATQSPPPLANVTLQVLVQPTHSNQDLLNFVSRSWQAGFLHVRINISKVAVTGGEKTSNHSWKSNVHVIKHNIRSVFEVAIPPIPGLPPAPPNEPRPIPDLASLIYLQSYHVLPPPPTLRVVGAATLPNPAPAILQGVVALSLPFVVSLPAVGSGDPLALARVETAPLALTTPNISLVISGHVLPLPSSSNSVAPVSRFASDFLTARASPILVTTDFLRDIGMKEELTLEATFPAAEERPELLRDVQITNMRISLHGEQILASAFVRAHIVPPSNLAAIRVNATRVWPDLLVYDGPAPGMWPYDDPNSGSLSGIQYDEGFSEPEPMPLPMPLPPAAFARIRPESWVSAQTEDGEDGEGVWVHAQVSDVPLVVLPGRDAELRRFIRKVVFSSGGARAGVAGISAVAARVGGLVVGSKESGELEMFGLPLRGETWIGKKDVHEPGGGLPMPKNPFPEPSLPSPPSWHPSIPHIPHLPKISLPTPHLPIPTPEPKAEPEFLHEHWPIFGSDRSHNRQEGEEGEELEEEDSGELWQVGVAY